MKIKALFFGVLAGALISATSAAAEVYSCNVTSIERGGGIAPVIVFAISDDGAEATVYDGYIKEYYGNPIDAKIVVANDKRYTFKWTIKMNANLRGEILPGIRYRATYIRKTHKFIISGFPIGYDNQYGGTGTCKRTK